MLGADRANTVVVTNGIGQYAFTFNKPFPSGYVPLVVATGGNDEHVYVIPTVTNTGFVAQFRAGSNNAVLANAAVRIYWIAM